MVSWKFYTYVHRRADTGEVFYVGKGCGNRLNFTHQRSEYWNRVVAKHGFVAEFVAFFIENCHAMDHEVCLIAEYRAAGAALVNHTNGGEGTSGWTHTDRAREKMSAAQRGRVASQQARDNMSAAGKGRVMSAAHRENLSIANKIRFSDPDERRRVSESQKGKGPSHETAKKIQQTRAANGNRFGWVHSEETKMKMSKTRTGKPINRPSKKSEVINADV